MEVTDDRLTGVRLRDGRSVRREAVVVATRMVARAGFLDGLGLRAVEHPSGVGEYIPADPTGQTEVPGVWVAGNVTDLTAQVGAAAAGAATAAARINADLVMEETQAAVAATAGTVGRGRVKGPREGTGAMSRIVLRVAQIVGVLVLAGLAIGVVVGLVQWLLGAALIVSIPLGAWWLYRQVKARDRAHPAVTGRPTDRRAELESRAVIDAAGRCGWCGSASLHKDEFGFPVTPLAYHRAEIDAML